jgi:hypothetical protein
LARQHATPILLSVDGSAAPLVPLGLAAGVDAVSEATIQALVHEHPSCLPIAEIDPMFCGPVPICMELNTPAGPIDNFMVTASGLPVLVECKLWRNPEGRREVVGQILDYAKELSRWSSSDLQREVSRRLKRGGNPLLEMVREAGHEVDEIGFNDALTLNLRKGRFLLLIVGDGIREGVEAIVEYLHAHAGLHFTLGLVEMPIYVLAGGEKIVVPRVMARTEQIVRTVIEVPEGMTLQVEGEAEPAAQADEVAEARREMLIDIVAGLQFDDPDQAVPKVTPKGYCYIYLGAPASSCWITLHLKPGQIGLYVTSNTNTPGEDALRRIATDWEQIKVELGGAPILRFINGRRPIFEEYRPVDDSENAAQRAAQIDWLRSRANDYVNFFRPRVRAALLDLNEDRR